MANEKAQQPRTLMYQQDHNSINYNIPANNVLREKGQSSFFLFPLRYITVSCIVGSVCFNSNSQKELSSVEDCWKRALCVCWQWEAIGRGGGLPTLLFKYTLCYWVTPAGVGVASVGLDYGGGRERTAGYFWWHRKGLGMFKCVYPRGKRIRRETEREVGARPLLERLLNCFPCYIYSSSSQGHFSFTVCGVNKELRGL